MRGLVASVAVLGLMLTSAAMSAEGKKVGLLQDINLTKGVIKIGPAEYLLGSTTLDGLQIGDTVSVVYTQEDEHDLPAVRTLTKVPAAR